MAITATAKLSEMPLRNPLPLASRSPSINLLFSAPKPSFCILRTFSSLKTTEHSGKRNPRSNRYPNSWDDQNPKPSHKTKGSYSPWLSKWPSPGHPANQNPAGSGYESNGREGNYGTGRNAVDKERGKSSIERIVLRLRNLGLGSDDEDEEEEEEGDGDGDVGLDGQDAMPPSGDEKLGDLLQREWIRPDYMLAEEKNEDDEMALPWERDGGGNEEDEEVKGMGMRKRRGRAPTLAELTIEDEELRRLRRMGMFLRERVSIPKAGLTQAVLEKIHDRWRKEELVRLKFHEVLTHDMKTAHEIVEVG